MLVTTIIRETPKNVRCMATDQSLAASSSMAVATQTSRPGQRYEGSSEQLSEANGNIAPRTAGAQTAGARSLHFQN